MVDNLEDTLNGGYKGLYGEVVTEDCYKIRQLNFTPLVIFDLGANIGIFTRFARQLFPDSLIVSVEPDKENFESLVKFTEPNNTVFINKAIGIGQIWKGSNPINGSGATYLNSGKFLSIGEMNNSESTGYMSKCDVESVMPDELINSYVKEGQKFLIKIDIEGNEHIIFTHKPSISAIKKADYICMETHLYSFKSNYEEIKDNILLNLNYFKKTHDCIIDGGTKEKMHYDFFATKKINNGNTAQNPTS